MPRRAPAAVAWSALVACALLTVYAATLLPGVGSADTAELQLVAATRGVAHPPGYPTWTLLAAPFDALALGSAAWRASLFSAVATSGAAALVVLSLLRLGARGVVAGAAALSLGLLATVWRLSTAAEVYTLNLLFVAGGVGCLIAALAPLPPDEKGDERAAVAGGRWLLGAVAFLSLGLGNHPTIVTLIPGILIALVLVAAGATSTAARLRWSACAAALLVTGVAQYGWVVARTFDRGTVYLGVDAGNAARLVEVVSRSRHSLLHFSAAELAFERLPAALLGFAMELGPLLPFAVVGGVRVPRRVSLPLLAIATTDLGLVTVYDITDAEGYYFPGLLVGVVFAGAGLEATARLFDRERPTRLAVAAIALPVALLALHSKVADRSREEPAALAALGQIERPALLVSVDYDASMTFLYETEMEHRERRARREAPAELDHTGVRVRHLPPAALGLAFGLDDVRRHVDHGLPFRLAPAGRLSSPGAPLYFYAPRPEWREQIAALGIAFDDVGHGMIRARPATAQERSLGAEPALERALVVGRLEHARLLPGAIARLRSPDFDPRATALRVGDAPPRGTTGPAGAARLIVYTDDQVVAIVTAEREGWLLLTDTYSTRWEATIDGEPASLVELDLLWWGVPVPAGEHRVDVRFLPHPFELRRWLGVAR